MNSSPFGFDPNKIDPKVLMELSTLVQQLPPEQLNRMQTLMHNMMAGIDVRKEMEEFEKSLPAGFREKLMTIMAQQSAAQYTQPSHVSPIPEPELGENLSSADMNLREARRTVLRAVADGRMTVEQAEGILFPER